MSGRTNASALPLSFRLALRPAVFNAFAEFGAFFPVAHPVGDEGLHIAHFLPAVVAFPGHQHRVDGLLLRQFGNGVGQLDTPPCARSVRSSSAQISADST